MTEITKKCRYVNFFGGETMDFTVRVWVQQVSYLRPYLFFLIMDAIIAYIIPDEIL